MRATFRETYQQRLAVIAVWDAERVPMMTGTDGKGDVPGQALHQEFRELAKAGLSPLKILQMTTIGKRMLRAVLRTRSFVHDN